MQEPWFEANPTSNLVYHPSPKSALPVIRRSDMPTPELKQAGEAVKIPPSRNNLPPKLYFFGLDG